MDNINVQIRPTNPELVTINSENSVSTVSVNITETVEHVNIKIVEKLTDGLKLDKLEEPDDNTKLDASINKHGLLPKLSGNSTTYLCGDGSWKSISISSNSVVENETKMFVSITEKNMWNNMVVYVNNAEEESLAFSNGARIVIRTDLI